MKYTIKNNKTGRSYETEPMFEVSLDIVWASQSGWFLTGCSVTISDENGNSKTFTK